MSASEESTRPEGAKYVESLENYERGLAVVIRSDHPTSVLVADALAWLTSSV